MSLPINKVLCGDCVEVMKGFPDESIDCLVTDPPYGIGFMGKEWDKALPPKDAFSEVFRVLKSGALAFVMSSPRQDVLWRMLKMLEECGFQLRQSFISWIYKTGFPKAYDVSKGIDKKFGIKRKVIGKTTRHNGRPFGEGVGDAQYGTYKGGIPNETESASNFAKKWNGWKSITGLKPALECILMVNKPLSEKTIIDNVLKHGTGAINVDACRIPFEQNDGIIAKNPHTQHKEEATYEAYHKRGNDTYKIPKGRFPANLLVSDQALSCYKYFDLDKWVEHHGFLDVPKASKKERDRGLETEEKQTHCYGRYQGTPEHTTNLKSKRKNFHPTVKPIKLMAYLIELGCPRDSVVLDPFVGSGTTCVVAKKLGRKWIGIDIKPEYVEMAKNRISQVPEKLEKFL